MDEDDDRTLEEGEDADFDQTTTDFAVVHDDLKVRATVHKAPNPLRAADPARLERYRTEIRGVIAARRAGTEFGDA